MDNALDEVEHRVNVDFSNNMEMLTFYLSDSQQYGINVFKIIEVIETPKEITTVPKTHPAVVGIIRFRGSSVTVIDISSGLEMDPIDYKNIISYIMICEYNNTTQGILVSRPNRLLNVKWEDVKPPGETIQNSGYLTALTFDENDETVQILDIEKIINEINGVDIQISSQISSLSRVSEIENLKVLVLDDSKAARIILQNSLDQLGVQYALFDNGERALAALEESLLGDNQRFCLIISDIEMPQMDGFTFTKKVKAIPELAKIHLVLHSSMNNKANHAKAEAVGADGFVAKFQPDEIAKIVIEKLKKAKEQNYCEQ
ncbi:MAG: chemotaxis protein CheV [Magnetococcales bacterium]|nr:chemotaxis protein CheV [Magnetococcales bacterium]